VVEDQQRHGKVVRVAGRRIAQQIEADGADVRRSAGGQLLAHDLEHAFGWLGQDHLADVASQQESKEPGPGSYVDRTHRRFQRNARSDRFGYHV
jgi:hypothetical protein